MMANNTRFRISSAGDLEIVVLYEAHSLMADIISPQLYHVVGQPDAQNVHFHGRPAFRLFAIRAAELWSEAADNVAVSGVPKNLSILNGLAWVTEQIPEGSAKNLATAVGSLRVWLDTVDPCRFWCPEINRELNLPVPRRSLWNAWANAEKHTLLRLQQVMRNIKTWATAVDIKLRDEHLPAVLASFIEWASGYCEYHATMVAELIGKAFWQLNVLIEERWRANNCSNNSGTISHPVGTSSSFFKGLHTDLLVFHRYNEARILPLTPHTSPSFKTIYAP